MDRWSQSFTVTESYKPAPAKPSRSSPLESERKMAVPPGNFTCYDVVRFKQREMLGKINGRCTFCSYLMFRCWTSNVKHLCKTSQPLTQFFFWEPPSGTKTPGAIPNADLSSTPFSVVDKSLLVWKDTRAHWLIDLRSGIDRLQILGNQHQQFQRWESKFDENNIKMGNQHQIWRPNSLLKWCPPDLGSSHKKSVTFSKGENWKKRFDHLHHTSSPVATLDNWHKHIQTSPQAND